MQRGPASEEPEGPARRRARALLLLGLGAAAMSVAGCSSSHGATAPTAVVKGTTAHATTTAPKPATPVAVVPHLVVRPATNPGTRWTVVTRVRGQPAAWVAQRSGVTLLRFDQSLVHVDLHAGSSDGGTSGWTYGDQISAREVHLVIAAINGGFKLTHGEVGFVSSGHVAVPLSAGLASIVTYTDRTSDIGAWREGVPTVRKRVFSVLENERLLVDRGVAASNVSSCIISCWGETIGSRTVVARAGLGITADRQLVWAAGEELDPAGLAAALVSAGAVRAMELDINPDWVAGYLYVHSPSGPKPVPVVPGQNGIAGQLLEPDSRDFLTFVAN